LNAVVLGKSVAEQLTTAHENKPSSSPYDYKEKEMDLYNNNIGRERSDYLSDGYATPEESILDAN
jgi:hypothetical protein